MYLAGKLSKFEVVDWVGRQSKHLRWWDMFVEDVTMDLLEGKFRIFVLMNFVLLLLAIICIYFQIFVIKFWIYIHKLTIQKHRIHHRWYHLAKQIKNDLLL